jgi:3'5'-cyclic nucleotide phosphodiesterase
MSVAKLLSRIVAPSSYGVPSESESEKDFASTLHDHTYGITSDPLTQFSCILSALIHDVDHAGVPNAQLVQERGEVARKYNNKSVAEQNSVNLAWNHLFEDRYKDLRAILYSTDDELMRFRQIVVNAVMATDIVDKDLKALRNARWDQAFALTDMPKNDRDAVNRKATIVIEHLIQASDVSHTMQHWHIYRKWNERFFLECYQAYKDGRAERDPLEGWYEGELGFFDFYIIPLAKKLKDCGVFGVSSDEYLIYAQQNRREWEKRGREVVNELKMLVSAAPQRDAALLVPRKRDAALY